MIENIICKPTKEGGLIVVRILTDTVNLPNHTCYLSGCVPSVSDSNRSDNNIEYLVPYVKWLRRSTII